MKFCIFHDYEFVEYSETEIYTPEDDNGKTNTEYSVKSKCKKCGKLNYFSGFWFSLPSEYRFEISKIENNNDKK
jgi:hypothetical protein